MGNQAWLVTRIITSEDGSYARAGQGSPVVSTVIYGAANADEARMLGAAQMGLSPSRVKAERFETTGLSTDEAIEAAKKADEQSIGANQMANWLRGG